MVPVGCISTIILNSQFLIQLGVGVLIQVKWKSLIIYILIILMGVNAALFLYFYQIFYKSDQFLPGIQIASINVSGYDKHSATDLLKAELNYLSDTPVSFYYQDYRFDTRLGEILEPLDPSEIVLDIWEQEKKRSLTSKILNLDGSKIIEYPIKLTYDENKLDKIGKAWMENLETDYVNASLEIDPEKGLIVLPSKKGVKVDVPSTLASLPEEWKPLDPLLIEMVVKEAPPHISENDLKNMGEISSFTTWYNANQINRSHNLVLATRALNAIMLKPGEVFSFNQTVGRLSYEKGYRNAMVIIGDRFVEGLGGGLCQVSSTLYNACLLAGLKIVERHNHNLAVAYVPLGQDATVAHGSKDFRFQNNLNEPIYIWANAGNGKVTMKIYGNLKNKKNIQVTHVVDQVIDFKEIRETKKDLAPGTTKVEQNGSPGYVVRSFRTFYNNDGSVARQEQLARDQYRPLNRRVYVGPPGKAADPGEDIPTIDSDSTATQIENEGEDVVDNEGQGDRPRGPSEENEVEE